MVHLCISRICIVTTGGFRAVKQQTHMTPSNFQFSASISIFDMSSNGADAQIESRVLASLSRISLFISDNLLFLTSFH